MARLLFRLGLGVHRRRGLVVLLWLAALLAAGAGAITLAGTTSNAISIPGQESTTALDRIGQLYGSGDGATAQVVVQAPAGQTLTEPGNAQVVTTLVGTLNGLPGVQSATDPLNPDAPTIDPTQRTGYSTVTYTDPAGDIPESDLDALRAAVDDARDSGLTLEIGGDAIVPPVHVGGIAEGVGVVLALVVLAVTLGSLVVAGLNLLTALVGVGVGVLGITIMTGFMDLQATTPILATMLGLAVGIDYGLFIITRYRQELRAGRDVGDAVARAVGTAGSAVLTAGLTVVIALAGLFVAGIPFLTQMGLAAAATVVIAVLVALTLVPAVLALLGRRVLPRRERAGTSPEQPLTSDEAVSGYERWVRGTTRRRLPTLVVGIGVLAVLAVPALSLRTTLVQTPEAGSTQEAAQDLLADAFGPGFLGPLTVLVEGDGAPAAAQSAAPTLSGLDDVVTVTGPIPNADGTAALLTVVPASGPSSAETQELVADVRAALDDTETGSGVTTAVTGATAVSVDVADSLNRALPVYLALVVGLAFVLLVLVFRSLLVPLVGVLGFLLTVAASLGATVAVFQWGWLSDLVNLDSAGPLIALTPILVIGILFGLAMDYQVFLVSRMHEAHSSGGRAARDAIHVGFRQAAPVVVAAAAIMFSVFAGFVPAGDATVKSIAFALAIGIAVDAFVVRLLLVPAALALLGERAWWLPRWLHWLPVLDVEGAALEAESEDGRDAQPTGADDDEAAGGRHRVEDGAAADSVPATIQRAHEESVSAR